MIDELELSVNDYRQRGILQPITGFVTGLIDGPEIETNYDHIVSYGIRRFEFDDYLLRRANARLRLGEPLQSLRRDNGEWIVNEQLRSPIVVGAGGHFCPVARWFRSDENSIDDTTFTPSTIQPTVVARDRIRIDRAQRRNCSVRADRPELFFCHDLKGYGWIFRKGNFINIGLGRENETRLATHVAAFVQSLIGRGKIPSDLPGHFQGHAYRLRTVLPEPKPQTNILLIGDAAGLADRHSGEGIYPAIKSGLLAAHQHH